MKLKKIYSLNKYSSGKLYPLLKKTPFNGVLCRFVLLFILLFSSKLYSQEIAISGAENLHLSEGTSIITVNSNDKITVITSSSKKTYPLKDKATSTKKEAFTKRKPFTDETKKIAKKNNERLFKKIKKAIKPIIIDDINSESSTSFQVSKSLLEQGTTNQNNFQNSLLETKNDWISYLKDTKSKNHVLYMFYYSRKVDNYLFARPPPAVSIS